MPKVNYYDEFDGKAVQLDFHNLAGVPMLQIWLDDGDADAAIDFTDQNLERVMKYFRTISTAYFQKNDLEMKKALEVMRHG
ncbi:MAG: hypothetical protein CL489_10810 [Acidobacteria bacterium]|mgnify:CR=1 FL=1|nr:hypothetical protein [Acidobacteriota bacterium]|tara:strand:- start:5627 stop:5869 length:243 start_codon:yes stop_codon:yes gene_type:complete